MEGIIPTRVGTSNDICNNVCKYQDHPHACGDKPLSDAVFAVSVGSSPRVWGQVDFRLVGGRFFGIIPTRVGTRKTEIEEKLIA